MVVPDHCVVAQHFVDQIGYVFTSYLRNVQVTVSDKRYVKTDDTGKVTLYRASLPAVYDYYPYGMPIKERTMLDASTQVAYITQMVSIPNFATVGNTLPLGGVNGTMHAIVSGAQSGSATATGQDGGFLL